MRHLLREAVAWAQFGPLLVTVYFLWRSRRRGSGTPLRACLPDLVGGVCYGSGFCLVLLGSSDRAQALGLLLVLASSAQFIWRSYRAGKLWPGPNSGAA